MGESTNRKNVKLCYILFGIGLLLIHGFIVTGTNDDSWFATQLDDCNLIDFLTYRYQRWTSRLSIEAVLVILARVNPWIWKICNVLIILLLVHECCVIWGEKYSVSNIGILALSLFLLPINQLCSAGWISTTINYLWVITIGIYTLIPLCKWLKEQKIHIYEYIAGCAACIFACNQEQVVAVLFVVYLLVGAYCIWTKRKIPLILYVYIGISLVLLVFILSCPGNAGRIALETQTWFPEFETLSLGEKILTGILTTFSYYFACSEWNVIFVMFTFVLVLAVFGVNSEWRVRGIALYSFAVTTLWGLGGRIIINLDITTRIYWLGLIQNGRISRLGVYSTGHIILECLVFLSVLCAVLISLFVVFGKKMNFLITVIIIMASLCSKIILGLSPTVYASGMRAAALGSVGFLIVTFMCVQKCLSKESRRRNAVLMIPVYIACVAINIVAAM